MRPFCLRVALPGGTRLLMHSTWPTGFDAALQALEAFPNALSVSVTRDATPMKNEMPNPTAPLAATSKAQALPPVVSHVTASRPRYSCADLGVCQGLDLVCTSCKTLAKNPAHAYAPGTITTDPAGMLPGDKSQRRELVRYMLISIAITVGTMLAAGALGYLWGVSQ